MNKILTFLPATLILFVNSCTNNDTEKEIIAVTSSESFSKENCSTAEEIKKNPSGYPDFSFFDTLCTKIDVNLIKIETPSKEISDKINQTIMSKICDKYGLGDKKYTTIDEVLNSVNEPDNGFEISIGSRVKTNQNNILCVQVWFETYYFGAAHPNSFSDFYNFDLTTGNLITLNELMNTNYKQPLNEIGRKNFIETNGEEDWNFSESGAFELSSDFAITPEGLLFSYDPYEIGAYAMGAPEVLIRYDELSSIIKTNGLLKNFLK